MQKEYGRSYSICGEIDHDSEFQFTGFCLCISSWKISPYKSLNQKTRQPGDSDSNSRPGATNPALITPAAPTAKVIIPALDRWEVDILLKTAIFRGCDPLVFWIESLESRESCGRFPCLQFSRAGTLRRPFNDLVESCKSMEISYLTKLIVSSFCLNCKFPSPSNIHPGWRSFSGWCWCLCMTIFPSKRPPVLARYVSIGGWSTATCSLWQSPSIQNISTTPCDPAKKWLQKYEGYDIHRWMLPYYNCKWRTPENQWSDDLSLLPLQARTGSPQGHRSPVKMKASHLGSRKSLKNEAGIFQESSNDSNKHFEQCAVQWIQSNVTCSKWGKVSGCWNEKLTWREFGGEMAGLPGE